MKNLPLPVQERLQQLPKGLRDHVQRARQIAGQLAETHGVDPYRVDLATAAHDLARATEAEDLLQQARDYRLPIHPVEERIPVLLHGPVATRWLQQEARVQDQEVLEAVRWHSTANEGLGIIGKIVFLADKLDTEKVQRYPCLENIRSLARQDLDRALLELLNLELAGFIQRGDLIHPASIAARNELLLEASAKG